MYQRYIAINRNTEEISVPMSKEAVEIYAKQHAVDEEEDYYICAIVADVDVRAVQVEAVVEWRTPEPPAKRSKANG